MRASSALLSLIIAPRPSWIGNQEIFRSDLPSPCDHGSIGRHLIQGHLANAGGDLARVQPPNSARLASRCLEPFPGRNSGGVTNPSHFFGVNLAGKDTATELIDVISG